MRKLMLILNPAAGRGGGLSSLTMVLEILHNGGFVPTVFFTSGAGDATRLVLEHANEYDCVTCIGGDGTLSETVAGLTQLENPPLLGYIPRGTANDVAATLKLSTMPLVSARTVVTGTPIPIDVGKFNDESYFTYVAAFGAFTEVSYETPREIKQTLGQLGYVLTAMTKLATLSEYPVTIEHDGGIIKDTLIFGSVSNSTSVAGIMKLSDSVVELNDGLFEVILISRPSNLVELNSILSNVLSGNFSGSQVTILKSSKIKFTFDRPVKWTRDGESGGSHSVVVLENIPSPIKIMTPSRNKSKKSSVTGKVN